ncbi:Hsp33 family molecular chaperone HslO [Salmonella enterica subsp. enterica]|nr:Hsp33 family molecular chaperone HslO [Salmonella enterica subsp. enterica]
MANRSLNNHTHPAAAGNRTGRTAIATSSLTATLKFAGDITVQLQGDGRVKPGGDQSAG